MRKGSNGALKVNFSEREAVLTLYLGGTKL